MARAQGARAQMALAYETVYGTPPVSGFRLMPFARATLGAEQPLLESELLGYGRDPLAPIKDAVTADGEVVIPIDVEAFGYWLKAAFVEFVHNRVEFGIVSHGRAHDCPLIPEEPAHVGLDDRA